MNQRQPGDAVKKVLDIDPGPPGRRLPRSRKWKTPMTASASAPSVDQRADRLRLRDGSRGSGGRP